MERLNPIPARSVWFTAAPVPAAGLTSGLTAVTPAGGRDAKHRPALKLMAYLAWVHAARATSIHRLLAGRSPGGLPGLAQRMVLDPALYVAACLLLQGLAHGNEGRTAEIHAALMAQDRMGLGAVARLLAGTDAQGQRQASGLLAKEA